MSELDRSLMALRLEVPKSVADHHEKIVRARIAELEEESERRRALLERVYRAAQSALHAAEEEKS